MRGARALVGLAAFAVLLPAPIAAQETNSRIRRFKEAKIPDSTVLSDGDKAQQTMDAFGACVLEHSPKRAELFLAAAPGEAGHKLGRALATNDCMYLGELRFSDPLLRGALYRSMYREQFKDAPAELRADAIDYMADFPGQPDRTQHVALRQFSDCVVRANPAASRDLTIAPAGSARAKAAFAALVPILSPCVPQGNNVTFSKSMIAGLIGESLYRLSSTPALVKKEAVE